jgi:chemotaxis protein MotA
MAARVPETSTVIGIAVAFGGVLLGFILEGGSMLSLVGISALVIIIGGTLGALITSFNIAAVASIPKLIGISMTAPNGPSSETVLELISFAEKSRREGLLSLEDDVDKLENHFLLKGIKMTIDGVDPEIIKVTLEKDIEFFEEEKKHEAAIFEAAGGYSPTMGIIGTVMGLVLVLANLGGDAKELGHSIAAAFIATLYGIGFANLFWLPIGLKLKNKMKKEVLCLEMIMTGVLSIQSGDNPSLLKERLVSYLTESEAAGLAYSEKES